MEFWNILAGLNGNDSALGWNIFRKFCHQPTQGHHLPSASATQAPPATSTAQAELRCHNRCLAVQIKVMIWSNWLRVPINVLYFMSSKTFAKKTFIFLDHCIAKWLSQCVGQDLSFEPSMETTVKGQQNRLQLILHKKPVKQNTSKSNHTTASNKM